MPPKIAVGKSVKVSYPAAGTIKPSAGLSAIATVGLQKSKLSNQTNASKIEKEEQADAAEIVALADFNRVYDSSKTLTEYGNYYNALDVTHSVMTDDVTYIVSTAVENDSSGQWSILRDNVESSISDADDLVEDLANVDAKIEQACKSLNFMRLGDEEIQQEAEKFLDGKLQVYDTPASSRTIDIDNILYGNIIGWKASQIYNSSGGSAEALKSVLYSIVSRDILNTPSDKFFYGVGQSKTSKNLNPSDPKGTVWEYLDEMTNSSSASYRLSQSAKMLSHIFSISSGIKKVQSDSLATRISFTPSRIGAIYEGTKSESKIPYRRSTSSPNYGKDLISLSLLQFSTSNGETVVPVEFEDDVNGKYKSGVRSLIRDPIGRGEYTFSDFGSYTQKFEESRQDIEGYSEMMLGYLDPENRITPQGVLRVIVSNFIDALNSAKSSESSKFQLLYTSLAGNATGTTSKLMRQRLLQIAGRIKYYQLKNGESSSGSGDDAPKKTTLITSKTSDGSERLKSDAKATTIQTEDKSDAETDRVIARTASASPPSDILATSMVGAITAAAQDGGPTSETLAYRIEEVNESINEAKIKLALYTPLSKTDETYKSYVDYYQSRVNNLNAYLKDLSDQLKVAPDYVDVETVRSYFEEAMKTTSGTFWSYMIKSYDDIVDGALSRLPAGVKLTDELGKTLYGSFDEFGIMSLIVECFSSLSAPMKLYVQKNSSGAVTFDEAFETSVNLSETAEAIQAIFMSLVPNIAVAGYSSSNLDDYRDELTFLTSDRTPEQLKELSFDSAGSVKTAFDSTATHVVRYQNAMAYLSAFSTAMTRAKDDLVAAFANILESSSRKAALDNPRGRKMMSTLTNQQMVYRRSLLDKYRASSTRGYMPSRFAYSETESAALEDLLSSADFCSKQSENIRLVVAAVPAGTIDSTKKYNNSEIGEQSYTGMIELVVHHRDHELDDLIFNEKVFLFDPQLYVVQDSFSSYKRSRGMTSSDSILQIAKKLTFKLYSRDEAKTLSYSDFANESRYQNLTSGQIDEILRNTTLSYLMETYLFKTTGNVFDESITLSLDDSISASGQSALISISGQNLPTLVLPTGDQIDSIIGDDMEVDYFSDIPGVTTGDRELIASLGSSYIMRSEKPIDRLIRDCSFDRIFIIAIDPDSFTINRADTISKNGNAGKQMLLSLQKQGLLRINGKTYSLVSRDPMSGGFSIGDISCQFIPHTASVTEGSLLKLSNDTSKSTSANLNSNKSKAANSLGKRTTSGANATKNSTPGVSKGVKL